MANITFSSPRMSNAVTVYAVAGDRGTILAVAKQHKIPIPFDCQDGECGSCLVEVSHLDATTKYSKYGISLTEKEKEALNEEKVWRERHKERVFVEEVVKEGEVTKVINDLGKNNEDASGKGARVPAGECLGEGVA